MSSDELCQRQISVSTKLSAHAIELGELCKEYLSGFEREDFFSFSDIERKNKLYKKNYYAFASKLPEMTEAMELTASELAMLIVKADEEVDLAMLGLLGNKLEAYRAFESALAEFSKSAENILSASRISPSLLTAAVRKLISALDRLVETQDM